LGHFDHILKRILWVAGLSALGIAITSPWLAPHVADQSNQGWVGLIGLYLTLVGLALAWHQLWKVRSATEAVQVSSAALIKQVQSSTRMFEAIEVKREIALLKSNVHRQELEAALQSLDTVKNRFALLKEFVSDNATFAADIRDQSDKLEQIEAAIRTARTKADKLRDPVKLVLEIGKIEAVAMSHAAKFALTSRTESHV
jgi:hypothetical protein